MSIPSFDDVLRRARAELDAMEANREKQKTAMAGTGGGLNAKAIHSGSNYIAKERERHAETHGGTTA